MEDSWEIGSFANMEGNIGIVLKTYNLIRALWSSEALMVIVR